MVAEVPGPETSAIFDWRTKGLCETGKSIQFVLDGEGKLTCRIFLYDELPDVILLV